MAKRMARGARRLLSPAARLARERVNILLPGLRPHPLPAALQTEPRAGARSAGGRFVLQVQARSPGSKTRSQTLGGFDFFFNFFFPLPAWPRASPFAFIHLRFACAEPKVRLGWVPRAAHPQGSGCGGVTSGELCEGWDAGCREGTRLRVARSFLRSRVLAPRPTHRFCPRDIVLHRRTSAHP